MKFDFEKGGGVFHNYFWFSKCVIFYPISAKFSGKSTPRTPFVSANEEM
jgi:hypothetical protein